MPAMRRVYVGTYTGSGSRGIYAFRFDPASGALQEEGLAVEETNPSFLAIHPDRPFLYAVSETAALEDMEQRIHYDLEYLRHWSPLLDLKILVKTALMMFGDSKAY